MTKSATPWTLPANVAVAVGPDVVYARYERDGDSLWLAVDAVARYARQLSGYRECERSTGRELVGRRYRPGFDHYANLAGAFLVVAGDFVSAAEGTSLVHLAPAYGEDDANVCAALGLPVPDPVGDDGCFNSDVRGLAGRSVLDVAELLEDRGALIARELFEHNVAHWWRCDTPLVYRAVRSWFVRVTALKERMLAANATVQWVPAHAGTGRFHDWLSNVRDWAVSRHRYWGAPVPVWRCQECSAVRVVGSRAELAELSGGPVTDLHRPAVDEVTLRCAQCGGVQRRVPDVLDCWFESVAMPYAQWHHPFEHAGEFARSFPGDFVVEYVAQTRGWFYTMLILSVALFDSPPFKTAVCHGVVLGSDGRKMSKRLKNYPDPMDLLEAHGSDALRVALLSSSLLRVDVCTLPVDGVRQRVMLDYQRLGRRLRGGVKALSAAVAKGRFELCPDGRLRAGDTVLETGEFSAQLVATESDRGLAVEGDVVVALELARDPELLALGAMRELVREVQTLRKRAGLGYGEPVVLSVVGPASVMARLDAYGSQLGPRVHAVEVRRTPLAFALALGVANVGGESAELAVARANVQQPP